MSDLFTHDYSIRIASLWLPSASEVTLIDMGIVDWYQTTTKHIAGGKIQSRNTSTKIDMKCYSFDDVNPLSTKKL